MRRLAVLVLVGCGHPAPPPPTTPEPPPPAVTIDRHCASPFGEAARPGRAGPCDAPPPARVDFDVGAAPTSLVAAGGTLVWTDSAGGIWTMPASGGVPHQLSDQRHPDFAFHVFAAGDTVLATSRGDMLHVALPDGPVTKLGITGLTEYPEASVADREYVYLTLFKRDDIVRVPVGGGRAEKIAKLPRGVLALHRKTLYVASYTTGVLVAVGTEGGVPRTIARGLVRPTAIAADAHHAFVYCEHDKTLLKIELANGATSVLARDLVNSDTLLLDGGYVYTRSWGVPKTIVRIAKDGSRPPEIIADDLATPYRIAVDGQAVYITSRDDHRIVRLIKR